MNSAAIILIILGVVLGLVLGYAFVGFMALLLIEGAFGCKICNFIFSSVILTAIVGILWALFHYATWS